MERQNVIKVFKPGSKQMDKTIKAVRHEAASNALRSLLGEAAGSKADATFKALQSIGGESMAFRVDNRKIKVELAHA
jgi:hypothetical protein